MPKCKDCGTTYRNMDHSVYECAQAGGKDAQAMMEGYPNNERRRAALTELVRISEECGMYDA